MANADLGAAVRRAEAAVSIIGRSTLGPSMLFCPTCGNMLQSGEGGGINFFCTTCPYMQMVEAKITKSVTLKRKTVDDVLGGAAAWDNVDQTDALCPTCAHKRAYFMQIQIRSADEPMTTFYKCVNCGDRWND